MKILYLGTERSDAQAIATALRGIDHDVTVTWASRLDLATKWLEANLSVGALVVDAQSHGGSWPTILTHVQDLGLHPAVVVIVPDGTGPFESFHPDAHDYIVRNHTLMAELPLVVARSISRALGVHRTELERKLAQATAALDDAELRHQKARDAAEAQLAERQAQYDIGMARANAAWEMVDEQLRAAAIEVERARRDQATAAGDVERLTRRESELVAQITEATTRLRTLERRLSEAEVAVEHSNARAELHRVTSAEQLASREREFHGRLAQEMDRRRVVEDLLAHAVKARDAAEKRHSTAINEAAARTSELETALAAVQSELHSKGADVERLSTREAELATSLDGLTTARADLERRLAATEAAFDDAATRATRERLAASRKAAEREAELDGQLREGRETCARLERAIADGEAALDALRQEHASVVADVERLSLRETDLLSQLSDLDEARQTLDLKLADAERSIAEAAERASVEQEAAARATQERLAESKKAAEREAELDAQLREARDTCATLERRIADSEATLDALRQEHRGAIADIERLSLRERELQAQLSDVEAARQTLELQLADADRAIADAGERARIEQEAAAAREADLAVRLDQERAAQAVLERAVADATLALRDAQQRHEDALAESASELAAHRADFAHELSRVATERDDLTAQLSDAESAFDQLQRDYQSVAADVASLTQREGELLSQLADIEAARDTLEQQLTGAVSAIASVEDLAARERHAAAERQTDLETRLAQQLAASEALERTLAETRSAATDAARTFEHEINALRTRGSEQAAQFDVQLAQQRLEHEQQVAEAQETARMLVQQRGGLQQQLEESRVETQRLFDHAGVAMFRCTPDGVLIEANRACTTLVGRRSIGDVHGIDFATAVFDSPNVLSWLVERCVNTRAKESIETTWRRKEGSRLFVRLSARPTSADIIEIVVDDLTRVRVLEERLDQAQRLEAVGRFASEVAVTCGNLLRDIHREGQSWLAGTNDDFESRQHGQLLFDEVKRAAGFLEQLAQCGDEAARTPLLVDLNTLVHDLEPVLKRVAGGDVEVHLLDTSAPLNVDVGTERVERLLVNLASYGRQRMPNGGRLCIVLGTSVVDRRFAAKHPNVRLGRHALITVTETSDGRSHDTHKDRARTAPRYASGGPTPRPGVDFGTLQGLVNECGGHLWMKVQPPGDMVAKIRLPLSSPGDAAVARQSTRGRERSSTRVFQS